MARITSYPVLSTVSSGDWIPITDTSITGNPLKNVTVGSLQSFIIAGSTLQTVVTNGNTYQGSSGPLWTWSDSGLIAASTSLSTTLSERSFKVTNLINSSYTEITPAQMTIASASGNKTEVTANTSLASNISVQFPLASGILALTTDIPASPWVPVTGGINYPTNKVGINTALPLEALDVTGNALFSGKVEAPDFYGQLNGTISTSTTGTTQASTDDSTKIATTAFVTNAVGAIPSGLTFQGEWDALNNTPNVGASTPNNGDFYIVSVAGTTNLGGITDWEVGDWAIAVVSGGVTVWQKIDNSSVLTGTGTGQKIAKWDGSGTSLTLTDSAISETNGSVAINDLIALDTALTVKKETIVQANTFGITSKITNSNTDPSISASVYGIKSDSISEQTVGSAVDVQAIRALSIHQGASDISFVVGSNTGAEITNGGGTSTTLYGAFSKSRATGTLASTSKWHIGSAAFSAIDNPNYTTVNFIGSYVDITPGNGTTQDMIGLQINNRGTEPADTFSVTGDLTYLKITQGIMGGVGGTIRAIHSEVTAPSLLLGSLESTGFIKTGGTATEFLMADGTVTSGSFTGNIPQNQITFGNASSNGITSSSSLKFSDTAKELFITGTSAFGSARITEDQVQIQFDAQLSAALALRNSIPEVRFTKGNINTYLQVATTPTQQNFISLPDKSGTVALLDDVVGSVTGTGSAGFIPVWSSTSGISASTMFELGTFIGIGTQTPTAQLETTANILVNGVTVGVGNRAGTTILGLNAFTNCMESFYSTAIGQEAMEGIANTPSNQPQNNTAVGYQGLKRITVGANNTVIGARAMATLNTGSNNTSLGSSALRNNTTGDNNVAVGYSAGAFLVSSSQNFTPGNSIFIGNDTKALGVGQTNQIVIGHEATGLGSNTIVLGNATITKTRLYGSVGIGTDTPASSLDVASGDVEVSQIASGIILKSPDGTRYRVTVANGGTLTVTAV